MKSKKLRERIGKILAMIILIFGMLVILTPIVLMVSDSLKSKDAVTKMPPSLIPQETYKFNYQGKDLFVYDIPVDGQMRQLALLSKSGKTGVFIDPQNPDLRYDLEVSTGTRAKHTVIHWDNFLQVLKVVPFGTYFKNTLFIMILATIGTVISCTLVAYAFSRFRAPGLNILFLVLLSTMMLPPQVTLIPTFIIFKKIGWYDTFWPLICRLSLPTPTTCSCCASFS